MGNLAAPHRGAKCSVVCDPQTKKPNCREQQTDEMWSDGLREAPGLSPPFPEVIKALCCSALPNRCQWQLRGQAQSAEMGKHVRRFYLANSKANLFSVEDPPLSFGWSWPFLPWQSLQPSYWQMPSNIQFSEAVFPNLVLRGPTGSSRFRSLPAPETWTDCGRELGGNKNEDRMLVLEDWTGKHCFRELK